MKLKHLCVVVLALAQPLTFTSLAHAAEGSQTAGLGAVSMALSPLASVNGHPLEASAFFTAGTLFIVAGIGQVVGETASVVLQNTVDGSKAVIQVSSPIVKDIGLSTGNVIKVVTESTGHTLVASGKILAFVPNEIGKELLYQSKLSR